MPDLYDYLKESFAAIESCGDVDINAILDAADDADYSKIEAMGIERCRSFVNDYIADTYYNQYLPGYTPIAFSIDDWYPPQEDFIILPRKNWWWHDMKTKTWQEYN